MADENARPASAAGAQTRSEPPSPGTLRAAAVLLGLGAETAAAVFRQLGEAEVRRIAAAAKALRNTSGAGNSVLEDALRTFVESMEGLTGDLATSDDVLRGAAEAALGPEVARRAFDGIAAPPPPDEALGPVADADPEALAMVLTREHSQTIALVLAAMAPEKAAAVMAHVPEADRAAIVKRMATVESVAPEVLRAVRSALTTELQALVFEGMRRVDGKGAALEVLRRSTGPQQQEVLAAIGKDDAPLAAELRARLFTFDDFWRLTDRDIQAILKEADSTQLGLALKSAPDSLREKILRNMSTRAAEMLQDDIAAMGPVRLKVVEDAQAAVTAVALELAEKGTITINNGTDPLV